MISWSPSQFYGMQKNNRQLSIYRDGEDNNRDRQTNVHGRGRSMATVGVLFKNTYLYCSNRERRLFFLFK